MRCLFILCVKCMGELVSFMQWMATVADLERCIPGHEGAKTWWSLSCLVTIELEMLKQLWLVMECLGQDAANPK